MKPLHQIDATSLREGNRFTAPLFFDDAKNMFLAMGKTVKHYHIQAIDRWKIAILVTEGRLLSETEQMPTDDEDVEELEELDEADSYDDVEDLEDVADLEEVDNSAKVDSFLEIQEIDKVIDILMDGVFDYPPAKVLVRSYAEVAAQMSLFFSEYKDNKAVQRTIFDSVTKQILEMLQDKKSGAMSFILNKAHHKNLAYSAVNVAIMAGIMAEHLEMPQRKIIQVVGAALLHDIGMLSMPTNIINKQTKLTNEEFEVLKLHTTRASRFITDTLMLPREIGVIVQQHHEHFDGSGYPEGRKGQGIELASRIIAVADAFEAMTSVKSYREEMIGNTAVKKLLDDNGKHFDPDVIKAFIQTMGIYPVGSLVMLNDSSVARVVETEINAPFLPVIKLLSVTKTSPNKKGDIVRLKEQRSLFIIRAVDPKEIAELV